MQVPKNLSVIVIVAAFLMPAFTRAQAFTEAEKTNAVQSIAKHIAANYVYEEKGGQIASHIQMAHHRGDFAKAAGWKEFNASVTESLQKFSNDPHLYVKYDPEQAKEISSQSAENTNRMYVADEDRASENSGISEAKIIEGNTGYLKLSEININSGTVNSFREAMEKFRTTDALIIDLRNNGGGGSELGPVLESFFLPAGTPLLEFTTRNGDSRKMSALENPGFRYDKPVYIIVNRKTASAAEAFAFVLQHNNRAKIVGENSAGAAYMNEWFAVNDHSYVSVSTSAPNIPGTDVSWHATGVKPDIKVKHGDPVATVLSKIGR